MTEERKIVQFMNISIAALKAAALADKKCEEIVDLDRKVDDLTKELEGEFHVTLTGDRSPAQIMIDIQRADMTEASVHSFMRKLMFIRSITDRMSELTKEVSSLKTKIEAAQKMLAFMRAMDEV